MDILVRNIADDIGERLQQQALGHGRSVEEEAAAILQAAVAGSAPVARLSNAWATKAALQFREIGFSDDEAARLELHGDAVRPADFE